MWRILVKCERTGYWYPEYIVDKLLVGLIYSHIMMYESIKDWYEICCQMGNTSNFNYNSKGKEVVIISLNQMLGIFVKLFSVWARSTLSLSTLLLLEFFAILWRHGMFFVLGSFQFFNGFQFHICDFWSEKICLWSIF